MLGRLLALTDLPARPDAVRDAVAASEEPPGAEERAPGPGWAASLVRSCRALGLRGTPVRVPQSELLQAVGASQPVVLAAVPRTEGVLLIVSDHRGDEVRVEGPGPAPGRWMAVGEWRALCGLVDDGDVFAVTVDTGAPRHEGAPHEGAHGPSPSPWVRLFAWVHLDRHDVWTVLVYAAFVGALTLTTPIAVQALVNTVAFGTLTQPLVVLSLLLLLALGFSATLRGLQFWVVEVLQRRLFVRVVADLAHRLPRVRREAFDEEDGPELVNRFFDLVTIQKAASSLLLDGLEVALTVLVGMVVLAFYHPLLLAFDVLLVAALLAVAVLGRRGPSTAINESARKYEIAAWLEDVARNDLTFKLGGAAPYAVSRADVLLRGWLDARQAHFRVVLRQLALVLTVQAIASAAVLGIGGWLVIGRQLTLGQLVAAELIVTAVVASLAKVGKHLESGYDLLAALDKVGHLLDLSPERADGAAPASARPRRGSSLEVASLRGGHGAGPALLDGVTFSLAEGSRAVLRGGDGAGKSLLVEMAAALREPSGGHVRIDGLDVRDACLEELRARIALVRGAAVVSESVLENIRMGRAEIDTRRVRRALETVGLAATIDALPDGLQTHLRPSGGPLSRGDSARLGIARAIVSEPSILVVDDALEGIEPRGREALLDGLFASTQPWTLLVVSDDEALAARADTRLTLQDGRVRVEALSAPTDGSAPRGRGRT